MSLLNKEELLKEIGKYPNSFSWRKEPFVYSIEKSDMIKKLENEETEKFNFSTFNYTLILFNEHVKDNELSEAQDLITKLEKILDCFNEGKNENNQDIWKFRKAILFVFEMCKCHLNIMNNEIEKANKILQFSLEDVDLEERSTKAALMAMEAHYLVYYQVDYPTIIINKLESAIKLDPNQHFWYFLLGKILARRRRLTSRFILAENKEIQSLEKAYELKKSSKYGAFFAESLAENSKTLFWDMKDKNALTSANKQKVDRINARCLEILKETIELCQHDPDECDVKTRCAISLMNLPHPYRDRQLAKKCLLKAKELNPNKLMIYERLGQLYKLEGNLEKARESFKLAANGGCIGSYMQLFTIYLEQNEKDITEIICEMKKLLQIEKFVRDPPVINNLNIQLGLIHYLIKNNLYEAVKFWEDPIKNVDKFPGVKKSKFFFPFLKKPLNILEIAFDEIRFSLQNRDYQDSEEKQLYLRILEFLKVNNSEFLKNSPRRRRNAILDNNCSDGLLKLIRASSRNRREETNTLLNQQFKSLKL